MYIDICVYIHTYIFISHYHCCLASIRVNKTIFSSFLKLGSELLLQHNSTSSLEGPTLFATCTKYVTHADSKIWIHIPTLHLVQFRLSSEFFKMFAILAWTSRKSCLTVRWWLNLLLTVTDCLATFFWNFVPFLPWRKSRLMTVGQCFLFLSNFAYIIFILFFNFLEMPIMPIHILWTNYFLEIL